MPVLDKDVLSLKRSAFAKRSWVALVLLAFLSHGILHAETPADDDPKPKKKTTSSAGSKKKTPPKPKKKIVPEDPGVGEEEDEPAPKKKTTSRAGGKTAPKPKKEDAVADADVAPAPVVDTPIAPPRRSRRPAPVEVDPEEPAEEPKKPARRTADRTEDGVLIPKKLPKVGIELEYAAKHEFKDPATEDVDPERYLLPLRKLKALYDDKGGEVRIRPWEKNKNYDSGSYVDPYGREWTVVPEVVNSHEFKDGFEVVTPPLDRADDVKTFRALVAEIEKTDQYEKGLKSSVHFTVDASHLIEGTGKNADASKLVDTILFIESHWPEIYGAISPTRYGTIVNRFGIPISGDAKLKELLDQLAALPPKERTFGKVQEIFESFHAYEEGVHPSRHDAWKFRAAQYKKLFGLGGAKQLPVIEFRIGDMVDSATLAKQAEFYQRIIAMAHVINKDQSTFVDPFKGAPIHTEFEENKERRKRYFDELNKVIVDVPKEQYSDFLKKLGFTPREFPKLARFAGPLTQGMTRQELTDFINNFDTSGAVTFGPSQEKVTFGWEVESVGTARMGGVLWKIPGWILPINWVKNEAEPKTIFGIKIPQLPWVPTGFARPKSRYDYLEPTVENEWDSGNIEMKSKVSRTLDKAIEQMVEVREAIGDDVRGFHLHLRIPKEGWEGLDKAEVDAFMSRVADAAVAWRLKYRSAWYAMSTKSNKRLRPESVEDRGAIRVQSDEQQTAEGTRKAHIDFDGALDIEIRGFMEDAEGAKRLAKIIMLAFKHPEMMKGFKAEQSALFTPKVSLSAIVERYKSQYRGGPLTPDERDWLDQLERAMGTLDPERPGQPYWKEKKTYDGTNILPLMGFKDLPWLSPLQQQKIRDADKGFARNMFYLMQEAMAEGLDPSDTKGKVAGMARTKVKVWSVQSDLHASLEGSLLLNADRMRENSGKGDASGQTHRLTLFTQDDPAALQAAVAAFRDLKDKDLIEALPGLTTSAPPGSRQRMLEMLGDKPSKEFTPFLIEALKDPVQEVREMAARILGARKDKDIVEKLINLVKKSDNPQEESAAVKALSYRTEPAAKTAILALLTEDKFASELADIEAVKAVGDRGTDERAAMFDEQSALELLKELSDRHFAREGNTNRKKEVLRALLNIAQNTENVEVRDRAITLLYYRVWAPHEHGGESDIEVRREAARILTDLAPYIDNKKIAEMLEEMRDSRSAADVVMGKAKALASRLGQALKPVERAAAAVYRRIPVANAFFKEWSAPRVEDPNAVKPLGRDPLGFDKATPEFRAFILKATEQLGNRGHDRGQDVLDAIESGLESPDPAVRDMASRALARRFGMEEKEEASDLIAKALKHKDPVVVRNATAALRGWDDAGAWNQGVIKLIGTLLQHKDPEVRKAAAYALGDRGKGSNIKESAKLIMDNLGTKDLAVRVELVKALAGRNDEAAKAALAIAMTFKEDSIRAAVIAAMSDRVDEGGKLDFATQAAILPLLKSNEDAARAEAIRGISRLAPDELVRIAKDIFARAPTEQGSRERESIILAMREALSRAKDGAGKKAMAALFEPVFEKAMLDPSPRVLEAAHDFYKSQDQLTFLRALKITADSSHSPARQWAMEKLASTEFNRMTAAQEKEYLAAAAGNLGYPDAAVRMGASRALSKRPTKATIEVIHTAINDDPARRDPLKRRAAAEALVGLHGPGTIPLLSTVLSDADIEMRKIGARALTGNHDAAAVGLYRTALKDVDPTVRTNAAAALVGWTDSAAWPALLDALSHSDTEIKLQALEALRVWAEEAAKGSTSAEQAADLKEFEKLVTAEVREILIKQLRETGTNQKLSEAAAKAIQALTPELFEATFNEGIGKNGPWLDQKLTEMLKGRTGDKYPQVARMLKTALRSSNDQVLKEAHEMLASRGWTAFHDAATAILSEDGAEKSSAPAKLRMAQHLLARYEAVVPDHIRQEMIDIFRQLAEDPSRSKRKELLAKLLKLSPKVAADAEEIMKLPDAERRRGLELIEAERLQKVEPNERREALKTIELALVSTDAKVRQLGSDTLRGLHYEDAVQLILKLVDHDRPEVRRSAVAALIDRQDHASLMVLGKVIQDDTKEPNLRHQAMDILKKRKDPASLTYLSNLSSTDLGKRTPDPVADAEKPASPSGSGLGCRLRKIASRLSGGGGTAP